MSALAQTPTPLCEVRQEGDAWVIVMSLGGWERRLGTFQTLAAATAALSRVASA